MIPLALVIAAFALLAALALWADATGFDPWKWLYGTDYTAPPEVQDWRKENW